MPVTNNSLQGWLGQTNVSPKVYFVLSEICQFLYMQNWYLVRAYSKADICKTVKELDFIQYLIFFLFCDTYICQLCQHNKFFSN